MSMLLPTLLTYLPYLISLGIGYLLLTLLIQPQRKIALSLKLILSFGLGLAVSTQLTFISFIVFNQLHRYFVIAFHIFFFLILLLMNMFIHQRRTDPHRLSRAKGCFQTKKIFFFPTCSPFKAGLTVLLLILMVLPLWYQSHFYVYGGWDAWSTWNLKAKFLFLGGEHWKNLLSPILWRSSPHYPLFLPLLNVWSWLCINQATFDGPIFTSFLFTLLSLGLLYCGLKDLTRSPYAFLPSLVLLTLPLFNKLSLSQYCDHVLGFYLLASLFCLIKAKHDNCPSLALLAGLFTGLLSFTKSEGLIASLILLILAVPFLIWKTPSVCNGAPPEKIKGAFPMIRTFLTGAFIGFLPALVFNLFYAPDNITFINGLSSAEKPITPLRIKTILGFYFFELGMPLWNVFVFFKSFHTGIAPEYLEHKWHGLWLAAMVGLILSKWKCLHPRLIILPGFLISYGLIITFYYLVNTYFEIGWWLQVSLHRILFAVLPMVLFWVFYSLWQDD